MVRRSKELAVLHWKDQSKGVMQPQVKRLRHILALLETARTVEDMNLPGLRLHPLKGDMEGFIALQSQKTGGLSFALPLAMFTT
jgi:toxin HigB-1